MAHDNPKLTFTAEAAHAKEKKYSEMDNILPVDIVICTVVGKKSKIVPFEFTWSRYMIWSKIVYDIQVTI